MAKDKTPSDYAEERATAEPSAPTEGITHRDDATYLGVPMSGDAHVDGPEDALAVDDAGSQRGDYTGRMGEYDYRPHQAVPIPAEEQEPGGPTVKLVNQREANGV